MKEKKLNKIKKFFIHFFERNPSLEYHTFVQGTAEEAMLPVVPGECGES